MPLPPAARLLPAAALALAVTLVPPAARAHAEVGAAVEAVELRAIAGGRQRVLAPKARVNVLVFFRTAQDRSADALAQLAACERLFAGRPVSWVGLVSSTEDPAAVQALVRQAGVAMPVLVDEGDALYDALGIRLHPMVVLVDGAARIQAFEIYRQVDYCEIVKGRIRMLLGEIDEAAFQAIQAPPRGGLPGEDPRDVARRDVNLGRQLLKRQQLEKAAAAARKALETAPLAAAFSLLGDVAAAQRDCARARRLYDQALTLDPRDGAALAGRAACAAAPPAVKP